MRSPFLTALVVVLPSLAGAQPAAPKPALPAGMRVQLDRATMVTDYAVVKSAAGHRITTGEAAGVFYDPATTAAGVYRVDATFTQNRAPQHPEAYGVIFGGSGLDGPRQSYFYFVVRGDGKFLVNHRAGAEVHKLIDWTASPAVQVADAAGRATNALRVEVGADSVRFSVNGTRVAALPAVQAEGIVGLRVNHALDVQATGPTVSK